MKREIRGLYFSHADERAALLLLREREREREDKDRPRKNDGVQRIFDDDDDGFSTNGFE